MPHGSRARIHHLTRNRAFLLRASLGIVVAGFLAAVVIQWLRADRRPQRSLIVSMDPVERELRDSFHQLNIATDARPRELCRWLKGIFFRGAEALASRADAVPPPTITSYVRDGKLHGFDARRLIEKHTHEGGERQMFTDFVIACLPEEGDKAKAALERLRSVAVSEPGMPCANHFLAVLLLDGGHDAEALAALVREGNFPDARDARGVAIHLAVRLKDVETLRDIAHRHGWIETAPPVLLHRIGFLIGDSWLIVKGMVALQLTQVRYGVIALSLFCAALWYIIFAQRSQPEPWRWTRPMMPIIAGVGSVWLVLVLIEYQENKLGMTEDAPFPFDVWYYLAGVGLREELAKLAFFALFLPWLLWRRDEGLALLTGAFVGIGFALEENMGYFEMGGGGVVLGRFLTANFMHASMTAIAGLALYHLLRWRFAHAERFVGTFLIVIAAHGFYDYFITTGGRIGDLSIVSYVIMALLANHLFDLLATHTRASSGAVSSAAVFLIGMALLIAVLFIVAAVQSATMEGIATVGSECVAMVPVALIYWRKFDVAR